MPSKGLLAEGDAHLGTGKPLNTGTLGRILGGLLLAGTGGADFTAAAAVALGAGGAVFMFNRLLIGSAVAATGIGVARTHKPSYKPNLFFYKTLPLAAALVYQQAEPGRRGFA